MAEKIHVCNVGTLTAGGICVVRKGQKIKPQIIDKLKQTQSGMKGKSLYDVFMEKGRIKLEDEAPKEDSSVPASAVDPPDNSAPKKDKK